MEMGLTIGVAAEGREANGVGGRSIINGNEQQR